MTATMYTTENPPSLTTREVIDKVKSISSRTVRIRQFKLLAMSVLKHIKGDTEKEAHALNLFLLKVQHVKSKDKRLKDYIQKIRQRRNEAYTRISLEKKLASTELSTTVEESLETGTQASFPLSVAIVGTAGGALLCLFPHTIAVGITIAGTCLLGFSMDRYERYLRKSKSEVV